MLLHAFAHILKSRSLPRCAKYLSVAHMSQDAMLVQQTSSDSTPNGGSPLRTYLGYGSDVATAASSRLERL